jgi:ribosomal protein L44E
MIYTLTKLKYLVHTPNMVRGGKNRTICSSSQNLPCQQTAPYLQVGIIRNILVQIPTSCFSTMQTRGSNADTAASVRAANRAIAVNKNSKVYCPHCDKHVCLRVFFAHRRKSILLQKELDAEAKRSKRNPEADEDLQGHKKQKSRRLVDKSMYS